MSDFSAMDVAVTLGEQFAACGLEVPKPAKTILATWWEVRDQIDDTGIVGDMLAAVSSGKMTAVDIVAAVGDAALRKQRAEGVKAMLPDIAQLLGNQALRA